jgi:hypothetical protein
VHVLAQRSDIGIMNSSFEAYFNNIILIVTLLRLHPHCTRMLGAIVKLV